MYIVSLEVLCGCENKTLQNFDTNLLAMEYASIVWSPYYAEYC